MKEFNLLIFLTFINLIQTQTEIFGKINSKLGNYYPKIENFHPPKGYQPVKGYEPLNYKPNILNYFLNHKKVPHRNGKNCFF